MSPVFPISVRAKNQLVFSLFGGSAAPGVVIGRNGQLYEQFYIDEFCARDGAFDSARLGAWSSTLREIQERAQARGKSFVYLISPSKAARYPGRSAKVRALRRARDGDAREACALSRGARRSCSCAMWTARRSLRRKSPNNRYRSFRAAARIGTASAARSPCVKRRARFPLLLSACWTLRRRRRRKPSAPTATCWISSISCGRTRIIQRRRSAGQGRRAIARARRGCSRWAAAFCMKFWRRRPSRPVRRKSTIGSTCGPRTTAIELGHYRRAPGDASNGERLPATTEELDENLAGADFILLEENEAEHRHDEAGRASRRGAAPLTLVAPLTPPATDHPNSPLSGRFWRIRHAPRRGCRTAPVGARRNGRARDFGSAR